MAKQDSNPDPVTPPETTTGGGSTGYKGGGGTGAGSGTGPTNPGGSGSGAPTGGGSGGGSGTGTGGGGTGSGGVSGTGSGGGGTGSGGGGTGSSSGGTGSSSGGTGSSSGGTGSSSGGTGSGGGGTGSGGGGTGSGGSGTGSGGSGTGTGGTGSGGYGYILDAIVFEDIRQREEQARRVLENRVFILEEEAKKHTLPPELQEELDEKKELLKQPVVDPLYLAIDHELAELGLGVGPHVKGAFPSQQNSATFGRLSDKERMFAVIYGILVRENAVDPTNRRFHNAFASALGEYKHNQDLFDAILPHLVIEGDSPALNGRGGGGGTSGTGFSTTAISSLKRPDRVRTEQWATVGKALAVQNVAHDDIHLSLKIRVTLGNQIAADDTAPPSSQGIDLPDLEAEVDSEIIVDNLEAMQAMFYTAMLQEMRLFQVVNKLVELFQQGMLPITKGRAGDLLYSYWKKSVTRLSEIEINNMCARGFGTTQGEPDISVNRDFQDLWMRFISAVSTSVRQLSVEEMMRSPLPLMVGTEQVRKSGRDLAANLSLHGYGIAYFAAVELQTHVREAIAILSDNDIKSSYGARDMYQVIDQVSALELGAPRNTMKFRTMAMAGAIIIKWLAKNAYKLAAGSREPILSFEEIRNPRPRPKGEKPTTNPTDRDLVDACEQYLAVTGVPDSRVEEYSQPSEAPMVTSRPIQIPSVARDLLQGAGISLGRPGRS